MEDGKIIFSAPWLSIQMNVDPEDRIRARNIITMIESGTAHPDQLPEITWLFSAVASYPLAYILPRTANHGSDEHRSSMPLTDHQHPLKAIRSLTENNSAFNHIQKFAERSLSQNWTWDFDSALNFSQTEGGYDPESLFSIARRFHLLNDLENNRTKELFDRMNELKNNPDAFNKASALVIRQNHHITKECERVLRAALPISQGSFEAISEFIQAESGHDRILEKALSSLGAEAESVPVLDCTTTLIEVFYEIAKRNILAFSIAVDIFERTSYKEKDPFSEVLSSGGAQKAAAHIENHRDINDLGGHENLALGFLKDMAPVGRGYAVEALLLGELLTQIIHCLSKDTLTHI